MKRTATILIALCLAPAAPAALHAAAPPPATQPAPKPATPAATARTATIKLPPAPAAPSAPDSLTLLETAFAKDSTNADLMYRLGVAYLDRERPGDAVRVLQMAVRSRPRELKVLVNLGAAYDANGRADLAQEQYRRALEAAPGDSVAACRLASSLYSQTKYGEAMDLLRNLIKQKPRAYCAYFTLGVAFADAGLYRDAIRMWTKVVEIAPSSPEAVSAQESIEVLKKFVQ